MAGSDVWMKKFIDFVYATDRKYISSQATESPPRPSRVAASILACCGYRDAVSQSQLKTNYCHQQLRLSGQTYGREWREMDKSEGQRGQW